MPSANCFDAPTLKDYLLGKLSDEQSDVVAAHLEACLNCEATVAELDRASDTLTNGLRLPAVASEPQTDDELQKALNKVQSLEALTNQPTSEVSKISEVSADRSPVLRDYRLLEPLGSGGMGQVFKAVHTRLDRLVAVKLLPARRLGDEQAVARFQREMRVIGQLSHPAIVQATDAGEVDGTHFLVMEYVEGCDLNTLAKVCGPLSVADACEITRQAAVGLEYAHQQGIVHRDIKPSNLMLSVVSSQLSAASTSINNGPRTTDNGQTIKILDLGLALLSGVQAPVDELTTVGQLMGTLDYMAPEQLEDSHLVGPRADVYALAATLSRLLTGFAPFANENRKTPLQKLRALATQAAPPIRERRADVPEDLAAIIDRALSRDSAARFPSMSEFAAALTPWCAGHDLSRLAQQVGHLAQPAFDTGCSLPGSLSPWERAGVREPSVGRHGSSNQTSGNEQSIGEQRRSSDRIPHPNPLPKGEGTGRRRSRFIFSLLAFFGLAAFGIIIAIETNKGTLIVESLRDGVEVRVKKSGKTVEQLELTTGPKSARLAAGEYEIEILGDADGLQIQNGKFVLKRGDTVVAKVTEVPKGQTIATKSEPKEGDEPAAPVVAVPRRPIDILDRNAKGMNTFFESNPDLVGAQKVRDALQKKVSVGFVDLPLTECVKFLKDQSGLEMFVDSEALTEEGIALDAPCHLRLKDVRIATALKFLLQPLQCGWTIDHGQVRITTAQKETEQFVTRWYPVGRLLPGVRQAVERLNAEGPDFPNDNNGAGGFGGGASGGGGFFRVNDHVERLWLLDPHRAQSLGNLVPSRDRQEAVIPQTFGPLPDGRGSIKKSPGETELCWFGGGFNFTVGGHFGDLFSLALSGPWQANDGEGGTFEFLQNVLVVRHTWREHADIESLLRLIEAAFFQPLTESIEIRPAGYAAEADVATRKKLSQIVDADFQDFPLNDVAEWITVKLDVQVLFDRVALNDEGIATDAPVTLHFKGISGELLLSRVLKPLQLDYQIEEGLLIVTTASKAKDRFLTKVYDIRDLLDRGLHPKEPLRAIESATSGPWMNTDGEGGTMLLFADTLLIVRQTSAVHDEVANFLAGLRTQLGDQPKVPRVIKTRPKTPLAAQPNQPNPNELKPTTPAPAKPTADNQPRYEGKTFDEWLAILEVERSPARLTDALEALRLLGDQSRAEMVADRVLKAFRVVEIPRVFFTGADPATTKLLDTSQRWFKTLRVPVLQKVCAAELGNGTVSSRKFILLDLNPPHDGLNNLSQDLPKAMFAATQDADRQIRESALKWVIDLPLDDQATNSRAILEQRLREALKDKVGTVALLAASMLVDSEADTPAVVNAIRVVVDSQQDDSLSWANSYSRFEAVKQAAVMGPRAAPAAKVIARVLLEPSNNDAGFFGGSHQMGRGTGAVRTVPSPGFQVGPDLMFKQWAAVALARFGKAAAETLPTVKEALKKQSFEGDSLADPRTLLKGDSFSVSLYELLLATEARLEEKPPLDLSNPAEIKITKEDLTLAQANWKLLRVEQELLKQKHSADAENPSLRELDQQVKAAEEHLQKVHVLNNARPKVTGSPPSTKTASNDQPKFQGKTLTQWVDDAVATEKIPSEAIAALTRDASAQDLEPLLNRILQAVNTERSSQGLKTNAQILALIGRKHFADRVTQAFLDLFRQRFEEELRKQGPELKSDKQLYKEYQYTFAAVVVGLRELSPNNVGPLLQRELKEGSLTGRNLALVHVRTLNPVPRQSQLEQLLPLLVPFVTHQVTNLTPAWEKHFGQMAWTEIGQIATTCSLNADQQRLLVGLAEKAITDPPEPLDPVTDEAARSVFQVLIKLSPKSERLLPAILKLESAPRTGMEKTLHSLWTAVVLAQLAEHDPKALPTLIRLLDEDAFSEETNFPSSNSNGEGLIVTTSPRAYAIARLGSLGPTARDALPVLKKQLESKNKAVVTAAEKAIKLIEAVKDDTKTD